MKELDKKKTLIYTLIAVLLTAGFEYLLKSKGINESINIVKCIYHFSIIEFFAMHFVIGFKKIYEIIFNNRYKVSIIMIVVSSIYGFFLNKVSIVEWITSTSLVLCPWWNIKFYSLLLVGYELFKIITNKNENYSIAGALVLAFSAAIQYNFTKIDGIILGGLFVVLFNRLVEIYKDNEKKDKLYLYIMGMIATIVAIPYTCLGFTISFLYVYIGLIIWIILSNKKVFKKNTSLLMNILTTIAVGSILSLIANLIYFRPYIDTMDINYFGLSRLFSYLIGPALPFLNDDNAAKLAGIISVYPIPLFMGLLYMYNNEKEYEFIMPMSIIGVLETMAAVLIRFAPVQILFMFAPMYMIINAVSFLNVLMIFYMITHINDKLMSMKHALYVTEIFMIIAAFLYYPLQNQLGWIKYVIALTATLLTFLLLNNNDSRYNKVLVFFMVLITMISGIPINILL